MEDILFVSADDISSLEEGATSVFKDVVVQQSIVHLIRNSRKYIPDKDCKAYSDQLKKVYRAPSLEAAETEFKSLIQVWSHYPKALDIWEHNWPRVKQLFMYGSEIRKVLCTTKMVDKINSYFHSMMENGLPSDLNDIMARLYLDAMILQHKWDRSHSLRNWEAVRDELFMDDKIRGRIMKYDDNRR